jgi:hypothetical protein
MDSDSNSNNADIQNASGTVVSIFRSVIESTVTRLQDKHAAILLHQKYEYDQAICELSLALANRDQQIAALASAATVHQTTIAVKDAALERARVDADRLVRDKCELENALVKVQDEIASFKKVSQLIAYEKQNVRLQAEVLALKDQLEKRKHTLTRFSSVESCSDVSTNTPCVLLEGKCIGTESAIDIPDTLEHEDHEDLQVFEKNINKRPYYVSDNDDMTIYEKEENGDIGRELGRLVKDPVSGRRKPVWLADAIMP